MRFSSFYLYIYFLCFFVFLLSACMPLPTKPVPSQSISPESWNLRQQKLQPLAHYTWSGRVAVAVGQEGFNAHVRWIQDGAQSQVTLNGPFGAGGVRIQFEKDNGNELESGNESGRGELSVRDAHGRELDSEAARRELRSRLGFEPPFGSLRYWILGVADPATRSGVLLDESWRLTHLLQNGWRVDYTEYRALKNTSLPRKLTLEHENVRVRVLIESWDDVAL
jgi:outer membrane lipoprotein LolB